MIKIVLASDNHGSSSAIEKILHLEPNGDYYLHLGDSEMGEEELSPFISVRGNNDYYGNYPVSRELDLEGHRILMIHGTRLVFMHDLHHLVDYAKQGGYDVVFYGHTHIPNDEIIDGIRMINPGSCYYNRDRSKPCYMEVYIDQNEVKTVKIEI